MLNIHKIKKIKECLTNIIVTINFLITEYFKIFV